MPHFGSFPWFCLTQLGFVLLLPADNRRLRLQLHEACWRVHTHLGPGHTVGWKKNPLLVQPILQVETVKRS